MSIMTNFTEELKSHAIAHLRDNPERIGKCLAMLSDEQVWQRPNEASNSIGHLILHLCGNIRQYIHSSLGLQTDDRQRDAEFAHSGGLSKSQLLEAFEQTVEEAVRIISELSGTQLLEKRMVQGFRYSGIGNILHVVEHAAYHTGQIALYTKILQGQDLGFYEGMDLNIRNTH